MARTGMASLILELRGLTDAEAGQTIVDGIPYWSDDQLQDILDNNSSAIDDVLLVRVPVKVNGTLVYTRYDFPTAISRWIDTEFDVVDIQGVVVSTDDYTYNAAYRRIEFDVDTGGISYYLRGREFNMSASAGEVWLKKAGHRAALVEWKAGAQSIKEDQEWQHCMKMYQQVSSQGGIKNVRLRRVDYL